MIVVEVVNVDLFFSSFTKCDSRLVGLFPFGSLEIRERGVINLNGNGNCWERGEEQVSQLLLSDHK
jgi:hypothetical protein